MDVLALGSFAPRNPVLARRALVVLTGVGAGTSMLFAVLFPSASTNGHPAVTVYACLVTVGLAAVLAAVRRPPQWMWAAYPVVCVAIIATVDLSSSDASLTAQVFFLFPVLYAGSQLRRSATATLWVLTTLADALVNGLLTPAGAAIADTAFLSVALAAAAGLLVLSGERTDQLISELEQQAAIDPLTGLLTRRVLDRAATAALAGAATNEGTALLLLDVDRFKAINDTYGHLAGDAVLQQLADVLRGVVARRSDTIGRLGGDELAVVLYACSLSTAIDVANRAVAAVQAHRFVADALPAGHDLHGDLSLHITISVGVAHAPTTAHDLRSLYANADISLYDAKACGRNRVGAQAPAQAPRADSRPKPRAAPHRSTSTYARTCAAPSGRPSGTERSTDGTATGRAKDLT